MESHQKQLKSVIMRLCLVFVLFGVIDYFFRTFTITELVDFFTWLQNSNWTFAKPPEKVNPYAEFNHGADIHSVAVSPVNSSLVASAGADNTIKLWNHINGNEITCIGHTKTVRCIAFSPAGDFLVSGSLDGTILWDVSSGRKINSVSRIPVTTVAISPTGHQLASAAIYVTLWNIRNPNEITKIGTLPHETSKLDEGKNIIFGLDFSPDGNWLVAGDTGGNVNIWDIESAQLIKSFKGVPDKTLPVKFSPDNRFLASGGYDGNAILTLPQLHLHGEVQRGRTLDLAFAPQRKLWAGAHINGIGLWAVENGAPIVLFEEDARAVDFSRDGSVLATGNSNGILYLWDVTPQQLATLDTMNADVVRMIYFLPSDGTPQRTIRVKLNRVISKVQRFYADQMEYHGFGRKTFTFETDARGKAKVYLVKGQYSQKYYDGNAASKIKQEISKHFDRSKNVWVVVVNNKSDKISGTGSPHLFLYNKELMGATHGGSAFIYNSREELKWEIIAHELGHAFGLEHDFRHPNHIMSYGKTKNRLSKCAAEWLSKSRFFNPNQPFFNERATINKSKEAALENSSREKLPSTPAQPKITRLRFVVTDNDGIHQIQFQVPPTSYTPPPGYQINQNKQRNKRYWIEEKKKGGFILHGWQKLNGEKETTVAFELPYKNINKVQLSTIDMYGNMTWREFDINQFAAELLKTP